MASRLALLLLAACGLAVARADLKVSNLRASNLPEDSWSGVDAYVEVSCDSTSLGTTAVRKDDKDPWWGEEFSSLDAEQGDVLLLEVFDEDVIFDDKLGTCTTSLKVGSHDIDCSLDEGGTLHFSYSMS